MKVMHVSTYNTVGGAARASYRIHCALINAGVDSHMRVLHDGTGDARVIGGVSRSLLCRIVDKSHARWLAYSRRNWSSDNPTLHSFGCEGAGVVSELNAFNVDLINLHWIPGILSVKDVGRLKKPLVWRLADMWAFCGGEHYEPDTPAARFRQGYFPNNRPTGECGPDLNRKTWEAKRKYWAQKQFTIVCTTQWLANCARQSVLFRNMPIYIIPNALDTVKVWRPIPKEAARIALNLPEGKKYLLMGADGGITNPYKGSDLLAEAVRQVVVREKGQVELIVFGQDKPKGESPWPCPVHWLGAVRDDRVLAQAYSAADVMIVPSRQEAFGQTASEAQACGTPVVAFDNSGPADIVIHRETGWLAKAFDTTDLAAGILWILEDKENRYTVLSANARTQAVARYSEPVVAKAYCELYEQVLAGQVI